MPCLLVTGTNALFACYRYKCPMLRGPMDMDIDKHEKIEELMASDLDHWLCNLYFEVVKLPRYSPLYLRGGGGYGYGRLNSVCVSCIV